MRYLTRQALIDRLREHLVGLTDDEHSICMVAARKGLFCQGFARFTEQELRKKFDWIAARRPNMPRGDLEEVINKYKMARTEALGKQLCCDAAIIDRDTCLGWDEFTDGELARFHEEWYGDKVQVVGAKWTGPAPAAP